MISRVKIMESEEKIQFVPDSKEKKKRGKEKDRERKSLC